MDVRLTPEQVALRDSAAHVAARLGLHAVADLDDSERAAKLDAAVVASGWRELRAGANDDGEPWASAVEVALVAEELARGLADTPFFGPTMAAELRRRVGAPPSADVETVVLRPDLAGPARRAEAGGVERAAVAPDARGSSVGLVVLPTPAGEGHSDIGSVALAARSGAGGAGNGVDLTRPSALVDRSSPVRKLEGQRRHLGDDDVTRWLSLGLAVASADLVGTMRGTLDLAVGYARTRRQYGVAIGSFQAVQHLLADARVAVEGSHSIALHAAWAVDALPAREALRAASAAKAYCARAGRAVCETAIQVHGGIGNTWECLAHVFLRRAILSGEIFGGVGANLERLLSAHGLGDDNGLR